MSNQIPKISVNNQTISSIKAYLKNHNLGNRGVEDGDRRKQAVGLVGEMEVHNYLFGNYPDLFDRPDGFDGGFDFIYRDKKMDVKTMERKSFVRPNFVNNFYLLQAAHDAEIIIFCSYHSSKRILEICGWILKSELSDKGIFYSSGTKRIRSDGSFFKFRQDNYEVMNKDLNEIDTLKSTDT